MGKHPLTGKAAFSEYIPVATHNRMFFREFSLKDTMTYQREERV